LEAHSTWKVLTSYLFPDSGRDRSSVAHQRRVIMEIVNDVSAAFGAWETSSSEVSSANERLAQLADAAAEVGTMIALQASTYRFEWRSLSNRAEKDGSSVFVLLPAFVKVADERGRLLDKPHVLIHSLKQRIGESSGRQSHG